MSKILTESVTRDLSYLYHYLKSDDYSHILFTSPWHIAEYLDENDIKIEDSSFNEYVEDMDWGTVATWLYENNRELFDKIVDWMVDNFRDDEQIGHTKLYFDNNPELLRNHWLIHFTEHGRDVFSEGFDFGTYEIDELGLTSHNTSSKGGTYAFAYDALTTDYRVYGAERGNDFKYGDDVLMFRASGVKVYHNTDQEYQVIFDTRTVSDLILIEKDTYNDIYSWQVLDNNGRPLYKTRSDGASELDNAINWVIKNYDTYRKVIETGAAPSVKNPNKFKKKFESINYPVGEFVSYLESAKELDPILIESIIKATGVIFNPPD